MKNNILVAFLLSLSLSNALGLHKLDQAMGTLDVEWVQNILHANTFNLEEQQTFLKAANMILEENQKSSRSLIRSSGDMIRLLFGLGVNASGCVIFFSGLSALAVAHHKSTRQLSLGIVGIGSLTWAFGLYQTIKGWNMSSAYAKLNKARHIQKLIQQINLPQN